MKSSSTAVSLTQHGMTERKVLLREATVQESSVVYQLLISRKNIKNNVKRDTDKFCIIFSLPSLRSILRPLPSGLNLK